MVPNTVINPSKVLAALLVASTLLGTTACQRSNLPAATSFNPSARNAAPMAVRRQGDTRDSKAGQVVVRFKRPKSPLALENYAKANQMKVLKVLSQGRVVLFQNQKRGVSTQNVIRAFSASTGVESSQPNYIYRAFQSRRYPVNVRRFNTPSAPGVAQPTGQYAHQSIQLAQAWQTTRGNANIKVAVVDSGVDSSHPDLRAALLPGASFIESQLKNAPAWTDEFGHGTHVAGIVGAAVNNVGVSGVAPNCKILPVKVLDSFGFGDTMGVVQGIDWASQQGARVINLSLGIHQKDDAMEASIKSAIQKGAVVVAATGNQGGSWEAYPAAFEEVIGVGSIDANDKRADTSNYGNWISVVAPGVGIMSTLPTYPLNGNTTPGNPYDLDSGTSMAAPAVAGVAALLLSVNPQLTPAEVKWRIEQSARDLGEPGFDQYYGHGAVNATAALNMGEMHAFGGNFR